MMAVLSFTHRHGEARRMSSGNVVRRAFVIQWFRSVSKPEVVS